MFFRGDYCTIGIGSNLGKSAETDWKKDFFHKEDEMKDKVLFANAGSAKFMALLLTLLTMFASCNFVGGADARTTTAGVGDPGKNGGMFKSPIQGMGIQIHQDGKAFSIDSKGNLVFNAEMYGSGSYGSYDDKGASTTGIYDVSKVAYVKFDLKSDSKGSFVITIFGKSENELKQEFSEQDFEEKEESEESMVTYNETVNIKSKTEYSEILFNLSGKEMSDNAKVRIENFAFYDRNDKEIVPKYIKYAEGEKPGNSDNPGDDNAGSFSGFFKGEIEGLDLQVWQDWGGNFDMDGSTIIVTGAWWGGAFLGVDGLEYDVSKIKSAKFKCTLDVYEGADPFGLYVCIFGKDTNKTEFMYLKVGEENEFEVEVEESMSISNLLFQIGGAGKNPPVGTELTIKDFTFYDEDGNDVIPQLVE